MWTRAFHVDGLDVTVDWEHRFETKLPDFARVTRVGRTPSLTQHTGDRQPGGAVCRDVDDLDAIFRERSARRSPR